LGTAANLPPGFFSLENHESAQVRHNIAVECLNEMIEWLEEEGQVGIFDASNTTEERRKEVHDMLISHDIQPVFIGNCLLHCAMVFFMDNVDNSFYDQSQSATSQQSSKTTFEA
ncbi:6494_t:CDS:2, partial [Acaulospora morrowiae]